MALLTRGVLTVQEGAAAEAYRLSLSGGIVLLALVFMTSVMPVMSVSAQQPTDYRFIASSGNWNQASSWANAVNGNAVPPSAASTRLLFTSQFSPSTTNNISNALFSYLEIGVNGATINGNAFTMTQFAGANPTIYFSGGNSNATLNLNANLATAASSPILEVVGNGRLNLQSAGRIRAGTIYINGPGVLLNAGVTEQISGLSAGTRSNLFMDEGFLQLNGQPLTIGSLSGNGGFLSLQNNAVLTTQTTTTTTSIYSGGVFANAGGTLVLSGGGTLGLTGLGGNFTSVTADLRVTEGLLVLAKSNADSVQSSVIRVEPGAVAGATITNDQLNRSTSLRLIGTGTFVVEGSRQTLGSVSGDPTSQIQLNPLTLNGQTIQGTLRVGGGNTSSSYSGQITGTGNFEKVGTGTFLSTSGLAYTGTTTVSGGTLNLSQTVATSQITVASGGILAGSTTLTNGGIVVQSGGVVSPGDSIGTINFQSLALDGGSTVRVEVMSNANSPVTYYVDLLNASDGATFGNSSAANRILIRLASLGATSSPGPLLNFDPSIRHDWTFLTASGGIGGFAPDRFTVDVSDFQAGAYDRNLFSLSQHGNSVRVTFTPVPEPAHVLAAALMFCTLLAICRTLRFKPFDISQCRAG